MPDIEITRKRDIVQKYGHAPYWLIYKKEQPTGKYGPNYTITYVTSSKEKAKERAGVLQKDYTIMVFYINPLQKLSKKVFSNA